ncbi:MAG: hypothetical protein CM1200mP2_39650 [Planctomycetaceae bacterium]|nr:MAG: hypothetical protein CM1200mP2_39650 [Planctomycetaceae bacterium]
MDGIRRDGCRCWSTGHTGLRCHEGRTSDRNSSVVGGDHAVGVGRDRPSAAAPTAAQRRQLVFARRTITRASGLIRRKKFKDAEKLLGEAEAAIKKVIEAAELKPNDRSVAGLLKFLELQKRQLSRKRGDKPKPASAKAVSFVKDVAPILGRVVGPATAIALPAVCGWTLLPAWPKGAGVDRPSRRATSRPARCC